MIMAELNKSNKQKIDVNTYRFESGRTIDEILKSDSRFWATDEQCLLNMIDSDWRYVEDFITEKEKELAKKFQAAANNPETDLKLLAVQSDAATQFLCQKHTNQELWEKAINDPNGRTRPYSKEVVNVENQINFPYELPSWIKNSIEEIPSNWFKRTPQQLQEEQEKEEKLITEIAVFEYEGLTYIPVRAFTDNEKNLVNNRNPKQIWNGAIIEKPKNGEQYSLEDFKTKSKTKDTDIFYCVERAKFFTPIENGIINLNVDSLNNHFDDDLNKFKNTSIVQDIIKNHRPLVFDKEKDTKLMTNISSVITESDVFLEKNETLGEVRIKFGSFKSGGVNHIIQRRMDKMVKHEGIDIETAQKETTAILFMSLKNVSEAPATKETSGRYAIYKNGIKTIVGTDKNGRYVVTGFDFDDTKSEAAEAIRAVNAQYGYTPEFLEIYAQVGAAYASMNNIAQLNSVVNENKTLKQKLENADKTIQEQNKELDIWTSKANADDKTIENLNKQLEQEKAYHTSSCVITVPQRDSNGNEIIGKDGKPLTSTLHCTEGIDAALGKLSRKCVDLTLENKQLREQLNQEKNRNANSQSDNSSWSD